MIQTPRCGIALRKDSYKKIVLRKDELSVRRPSAHFLSCFEFRGSSVSLPGRLLKSAIRSSQISTQAHPSGSVHSFSGGTLHFSPGRAMPVLGFSGASTFWAWTKGEPAKKTPIETSKATAHFASHNERLKYAKRLRIPGGPPLERVSSGPSSRRMRRTEFVLMANNIT